MVPYAGTHFIFMQRMDTGLPLQVYLMPIRLARCVITVLALPFGIVEHAELDGTHIEASRLAGSSNHVN